MNMNTHMNRLASLIFAALLPAPLASLHAAEVAKLRCEYLNCHYQGSARVYCMVGYSLAEAMKPLLTTKP
jgi:hypothetical protein